MESKNLRESYYRYLRYFLAKDENTATAYDKFMALAYAIRNELVDNWIETQKYYHESNLRRVYFLSMEYIFGKSLNQNMVHLDIENPTKEAVQSLGFSIDQLYTQEDDFELGNAGKGRMAACLFESMTALGLPAMAYGLRYDYAQFQQQIKNGVQIERPCDWLHKGHPWEIIRPEYACMVNFAGECKPVVPNDPLGPYAWTNTEQVYAVPYDVPISGVTNKTVNTLRLWSARAAEEFLPDYINHNDYVRACEEKSQSGRITKVLFPEEDVRRATELRMKQQFFFISAAIQDIIRRYKIHNKTLLDIDKKVVIQLNGSRCALAIPEFIRILVDNENVPWEKAWELSKNVFAYTSHALSRDNLEIWPVYKVAQILPRHMQIIFDINQMHLDEARKQKGIGSDLVRELSLIEEGEVKRIRLGDLAALGSFSICGVSREQAEQIKKKVFPHFSIFFPAKFSYHTAGVSHRRWLQVCNKPLTGLISSIIGNSWIAKAQDLQRLEPFCEKPDVISSFQKIKKQAKETFSDILKKETGIVIDPNVMFDVQGRKIHTSKRQVLHLFHILHRYLRVKDGEKLPCKRLHIFSGKASPSDFLGKQIIHLINVVADLVNNDENVRDYMKIIFIPNFGMTWAERLLPAADLSEQIATASQEASATFGMKYLFNGCLTIASKCGTNIELIEKIGEYIFPFGKTGDELVALGDYTPHTVIDQDIRLKNIFNLLDKVIANVPEGQAINPLISTLRDTDRQFVLLDFDDYCKKQQLLDTLYCDPVTWAKYCLINISRAGWFSSDRTIEEYVKDVWKVDLK